MADMLTSQQKMAVENRGGSLLVSAAAGSGKTKVLVDRLLSYINDPVNPQDIDSFLMITYTKAAAAELRGKIASKLSAEIALNPQNQHLRKQLQRLYLTKISTVHAFCADILREFAYLLDIPADFRVADENECVQLQTTALEKILNTAYEHLDSNEEFIAFIDSQGLGRDDRQVPQLVLSVYRRAKCHLNYEQWLNQCLEGGKAADISDLSETAWGSYLINDLRNYLELQIQAIRKCVELAQAAGDMDKPAALLSDTVVQLERLFQCTTWDQIYSLRDIAYGTLAFSKKCEDLDLIDQIKAVRDACKEGLKKKLRRFNAPSDQLLSDIQSTDVSTRGLVALVRNFDKEYSYLKKSRHILDFNDLEHKVLDLLWGKSRSGITSIAREIGNRYCQIMVDEYQDSNAVQDAIFQALSTHRNNCFMVGDVKQSIYQFRLADPGIFLEKYNRFDMAPDVADGEGRKVLLSSNFRSSGGVIEAVNDVFYTCMYEQVGGLRYSESEALSEGITHINLPDPEIEFHCIPVKNDTYAEEAAFVAGRIRQMLDNGSVVRDGDLLRPVRPEDIVILLRSPGSVGKVFQSALENNGIACSFDKGTELMETEEVQFIHGMLQVISNPLQDIPLIAVLSSRVFGFSADELAQIRCEQPKVDFYSALTCDKGDKTFAFLQALEQLRLDARMLSMPQLIERILILTDADVIYQSLADGAIRLENIRNFTSIAASFSSMGSGTLEGFLDYLQIITNEGYQVQGSAASSAVQIISIHKSKGLEYPVVFLCGLSKSFNMEQTREQVLCDSALGLGLSCVDPKLRIRYPTVAKQAIIAKMHAQALSEELRVLYVAMTRPKDRLIMTYASASLEKELTELAARMDISSPVLLSSDVGSAGEWVLLAAMRHSEADCLHRMSRKPNRVNVFRFPWKFSVDGEVYTRFAMNEHQEFDHNLQPGVMERMSRGLSFEYPYLAATSIPSKMTATQLKGRYKDQEIAENTTSKNKNLKFRKPEFLQSAATGSQYGIAIHSFMQHVNFSSCEDLQSLRDELDRLVSEGHITPELARIANLDDVMRFFNTEIGKMLRSGAECIREFKFTILDDADEYVADAEGESILVQGVVDCALIDDHGITVIDYKTDNVETSQLQHSISNYRGQVCAYARALQKIFERPVVNSFLYYFHLGEMIRVGD